MLKSSEHKKLIRYSNDKYPNLKGCSNFRSVNPPISFYYQILRKGDSLKCEKVLDYWILTYITNILIINFIHNQ